MILEKSHKSEAFEDMGLTGRHQQDVLKSENYFLGPVSAFLYLKFKWCGSLANFNDIFMKIKYIREVFKNIDVRNFQIMVYVILFANDFGGDENFCI